MDETSNATIWSNCRTVSEPTYIHRFRVSGGKSKGEMEERYWESHTTSSEEASHGDQQ